MSGERELEGLIARLERDVSRTVGDSHVGLVRDVVALNGALVLTDRDRSEKVVGDLQQALHDTFVDTT